jgi:serine protease 16
MSACPVSDFTGSKSLRYLSSRQALADLANFHDFAVAKYGLTDKNKWISFGGSYPGMLAGWFRLKYPHLVHGSIASSAPVQAKLDMQGYNDVAAIAYSVKDNNVGGSPTCRANIADGHAQIKTMFGSETGRNTLAKLFGRDSKWYESIANQGSFAGNGVAYFPSQGNDPSCTEPCCNIRLICEVMTSGISTDSVARLANLTKMQSTWIPADLMSRVSTGEPDYWGYQTCAEFGFYQTCEVGTQCMFAQGYDLLKDQVNMCTDEFKIPVSQVASNIELTNTVYGGNKPVGTCLTYPNGEVDPWHSLSILNATVPGITAIMVSLFTSHRPAKC